MPCCANAIVPMHASLSCPKVIRALNRVRALKHRYSESLAPLMHAKFQELLMHLFVLKVNWFKAKQLDESS